MQKECKICGDIFEPHPKVGKRQKVCRKTECKREHHRQLQESWCNRNPDYFKGRYPILKKQIKLRRDKLKKQRAIQKALSKKKQEFDIQEELTCSNNKVLTSPCRLIDIQEELKFLISSSKRQLEQAAFMIYKIS